VGEFKISQCAPWLGRARGRGSMNQRKELCWRRSYSVVYGSAEENKPVQWTNKSKP
jgi:hypothetical protein